MIGLRSILKGKFMLLLIQTHICALISAIVNLIDEVPLPPPGRFEIGLTINSRPLFFSRPPINQVPILKNVNKAYNVCS